MTGVHSTIRNSGHVQVVDRALATLRLVSTLPVAALGVSGPSGRMTSDRFPALIAALQRYARAIAPQFDGAPVPKRPAGHRKVA